MEFVEIARKLKHFAAEHNLKSAAFAHGEIALRNWAKEYPEEMGELTLNDLRFEFVRQEFIFERSLYASPILRTRLGIFLEPNDDYLGYYELDTNAEGEHIDDWLIIE